MGLTSIITSVGSITNQLTGQGAGGQQAAPPAAVISSSGLAALIQDSFTPSDPDNSSQGAAQEAGLFQVSQLALAAATAGSLALQAAQSQLNPIPASAAQPVPNATANPVAILLASTDNTNEIPTATAQASAAVAQVASPTFPPGEILAFNQALSALGLTNSDIQKLDQIATLVNVFSPAAFNDLIRQFQALAQQAAQLSAVSRFPGPIVNSGGYRVQGLSVQFNRRQEPPNGGAVQGSGQGGGTLAAFTGLQLGAVQFTLTSAAGQSATVQAP